MKTLLVSASALFLLLAGQAGATQPSEAEALFARYQALGRAFDPSLADLAILEELGESRPGA